ncbi:hypothetical protein EPUL_000999 [Erysiphe pulchra]|uniref:Uncharacterized protein n=1 Tax=Erysiphe pulchra TaxID=225359 RepID=A0A2S4PZT0_9PEZI|nr:hypothetical protein EPUL_000999 [Erysiphe pulchra]
MSSVGRSDVSGNLNYSFNHHSAQPHIDHPGGNQAFPHTVEHNTSSIIGANLSSNENLECPANSTTSFTNPSANPSANVENLLLQKEVDQLRAVLSQTSVKATQLVLGNQWRDLQFSNLDEASMSSVCQIVLKNANSSVLEKAFQDEALFESSICDFMCQKKPVIIRVLQSVTWDQLSSFVPESTLDKALAQRVKYVPARDLINWLASADRLGYKPDDILDDDELVIPNNTSQDYKTTQGQKSVDKNQTVNNQIKPSLERVKDTLSGATQVDTTNTTQQAQNSNSTELQGQEIARNSQMLPSDQSREQYMKIVANRRSNQAENNRPVLIENAPIVAIPHPSNISDGSNAWLPGRTAQCPTFQPSESSREPDGTSNYSSNLKSQYVFPSPYSPQTFGNNPASSRRPSALNISHTTEHISQPSPQFGQSTQMNPLITSHITQKTSSLRSPTVVNSPPLNPPSAGVSLLQSEVSVVDEMLKKQVASIPAGVSQDQRLATINNLVNLASTQKHKLGISHGIYVDKQQIINFTREAILSDPCLQARPAVMYGLSNNYSRANPSSTGSNRASPALENGSPLSNCVVTDRNPNSLQLAANTRNLPQAYTTPYPNCESHQTFKRPRSESNVINPRPAGPNQSFNNRPSNLNTTSGVNSNSYFMNAQYQSVQVEPQPITSGPIIQNTDSVNLVANHSPVSISATSELGGSKDI